MQPVESLGLSANQWQFLSAPDRYVSASKQSDRKLVLESTQRQFLTARDILARLNGSYGAEARRGILLADDVGLGKTTVAALVAWVVALAGRKRKVRILAPNEVMVRRWEEELLLHVEPLQKCAPTLDVQRNRVKARRVGRLSAGSIQIVKHSYAALNLRLDCDLLIIDEAHRAKGENTAFSASLKRQKKYARRVLILTATPFSIRLEELQRMLTLIGCEASHVHIRSFSRTLDDLYSANTARSSEIVAERLAERAEQAVNAISSFVIRHAIDDLPREQTSFGSREDWNIVVPPAKPVELELIIRMDRALHVAKSDGYESSKATHDPRFHVGWRHFDAATERLKSEVPLLTEPAKAVVENQLKCMKRLRSEVGIHTKMGAVAAMVKTTIEQGEKVVLFCHYHATAQELTAHLASVITNPTTARWPKPVWKKTWNHVLEPADHEHHTEKLRDTFIEWLCSDLICAQTWSWLPSSTSEASLIDALRETKGRHCVNTETIADAAHRLYLGLLHSKSSRAVLSLAEDAPDHLPGANGTSRVLGVCERSGKESEGALFIHNRQPDTVISVFNSPFGPDVLVVTDKLSEGIDLHRYCRHLIHYELDPSPIRTVQRNGRLRRVNSWAAATGQPILYAYPSFGGTRDHRLVQIMKKRIGSFSLLLGGVQDFNVDEVLDSEEKWRNDVIASAKSRLAKAGGQLRARQPGET
jgi:ERCC4-related helicase